MPGDRADHGRPQQGFGDRDYVSRVVVKHRRLPWLPLMFMSAERDEL